MCSVSEDIEEIDVSGCSKESFGPASKTEKPLNTCRKCMEQSEVVLQKKDPFCRSCFMSYCSHKFRAAIGKSKAVRPGSKVLLAYSGGMCSSAMVHMVKEALDNASHKKLLFVPGILHIDESFIVSTEDVENKSMQEEICNNLKSFNYPIWFSSLEMTLRENDDAPFCWKSGSDFIEPPHVLRDRLQRNLTDMKSLSARQDYVNCLRMQLIKDIAKDAGYSHIFVGDCTNHLAVKMLSDIATGRGSQSSYDMSFHDCRSSVGVCRLMREFSNEEIVHYNSFKNIHYITLPTPPVESHTSASIQQLTKAFVHGLQENFPATVYTIFRTGSKVSPSYNSSKTNCLFCESPRDNVNPVPCSALEALSLSAKLSRSSIKQGDDDEKQLGKDDWKWLKQHLCHGCGIIFSETNDCSCFPPVLKTKAENIRSVMRSEIEEFIIK